MPVLRLAKGVPTWARGLWPNGFWQVEPLLYRDKFTLDSTDYNAL